MFVQATLIGSVVTVPDLKATGSGTPVANFGISTKRKARQGTQWVDVDVTTWVVKAYGRLAVQAMGAVRLGQSVVVTGMLAASTWTDRGGVERTRIEMRAQSLALNLADTTAPVTLTLRGSLAGEPQLFHEGPAPLAELEVRTSRIRRTSPVPDEVDVTVWPVTATGDMAERIAESWTPGMAVVVTGEVRPLPDPGPHAPQLEVWAHSAGQDLVTEETKPVRGR